MYSIYIGIIYIILLIPNNCTYEIRMFRVCAPEELYTYLVNQQMRTGKICFDVCCY
jgi:hypothetical protein